MQHEMLGVLFISIFALLLLFFCNRRREQWGICNKKIMLSQYDINFPIADPEITIGQTKVKTAESVKAFDLY
jgi:hypothetical protein